MEALMTNTNPEIVKKVGMFMSICFTLEITCKCN